MRVPRPFLSASSLVLLTASCRKEGTGPDPNDPNALGLAVAVRVDSATFRGSGEFVLELIPSTSAGDLLVDRAWTISATVTAPARVAPALVSQVVQMPDSRRFRVALDVDNSGSMAQSDPTRQRARAARAFWMTLFAEQSDAEASLLYFGLGALPPTPGFVATRVLRSWTSDPALLAGLLDTLQLRSRSPMYTSALEVVRWIDSSTASDTRRALVLLTDARTNREAGGTPDALMAAAGKAGVRIYTVGLGAASDRGADTDIEAVTRLQELSNATGGLYAGAATPDRLSSTLQSFAASISRGMLTARIRLSPVPARGIRIAGRVRLANPELGVAQAPWSFDAP
ncbi:MAG: vWA domain-containing protein [Gemmatimonadaceae bacterium]